MTLKLYYKGKYDEERNSNTKLLFTKDFGYFEPSVLTKGLTETV